MKGGHFGGEGSLVAVFGGESVGESGELGAGLGKAENVIDEKEDVFVILVAKILGDGG